MSRIILIALLTISSFIIPDVSRALSATSTNQEDFWAFENSDAYSSASDITLPFISLILPGAGQLYRKQLISGTSYATVGLAGAYYSERASRDFKLSEKESLDISSQNTAVRKYILGLQVYQASGGMSAYHSFRSAVWQRQKFDQYRFLGGGETPLEILKAPFNFSYLTRSSTYIPLLVGGSLSWYLATHPGSDFTRRPVGKEDVLFSSAFSYGAGTHEEAVFRGWIMPVLHEQGLSAPIANVGQGILFALAHLGSNNIPLPQLFLGLHLGRVTQRNQWTIGEAVFIHTWWDVFAFLSSYHLEKLERSQDKKLVWQPRLKLPPLVVIF
jgi:membrane protease YdiL (CAAX protease family)